MAKKIPLNRLFAAIDRKDRNFYDNLDEEEKKGFSAYLALRYASAVKSESVIQDYYLRSTNVHVNKHFFDMAKSHKKLQWLLLTTISPGVGSQYHEWIAGLNSKATADDKKIKILEEIYPDMKTDDVRMLAKLSTEKEVLQLAEDYGIDSKK